MMIEDLSVKLEQDKPKTNKPINFTKLFAISLGGIIGLSHIGLIGMVSRKHNIPLISPPVGPYTSYVISADEDGYKISYTANDPKTMIITKDIKEKAGFLGLSNNTTQITEEYVMDGKTNQGGAVSNSRSWLDQPPGLTNDQAKEMKEYRKSEACIKAIGSAEGTGRLVGTSVGASAAPAFTNIPYIGWVAAGWVAMFGGNQGADIGGNMAENLNKNC
tara:strand:+ start:3415 stop:4068 length:654 start_codon:yes stop_codon:yes gene_type:complete